LGARRSARRPPATPAVLSAAAAAERVPSRKVPDKRRVGAAFDIGQHPVVRGAL